MELKKHFEFGISDLGLRIEEKAENSGVRIQETGGKD